MFRHQTVRAFAIVALAGLGCGRGAEPAAPAAAQTFTDIVLAPGQTATPTGTNLQVRFDRVESDSRCPIDVTCVWAGEAAMDLQLTVGDSTAAVELRSSGAPGARVMFEGYEISVQRLDPAPHSQRPIDPRAYRLKLAVQSVTR